MTCGKVLHIAAVGLGAILLTGCVMTEKYEAEKARALNFQRLLAQEEKRTGDLDSETKRLKRENVDLEARNREMAAQVQAVREQLGRIQEEATAMREAAMLKEQETLLAKPRKAAPKPRRPEREPERAAPAQERGIFDAPVVAAPEPEPERMPAGAGGSRYHQVKPGETLYRLSRQYGVDVPTLKRWNNLGDNQIEVGQRLLVGRE
ncbi:MAG: LysM peptidoglycan-binding domain-containing protein [Nitrospirae bacterium]|nr:LysM peptidoglycan-binding domain-containing protein [Nitrospirota bacterium]